MIIRNALPSDYPPVIAVLNDWWGGRNMSNMLPRLFFVHFQETSFISEEDGRIIGFLIGFLSQTYPHEAYIHFVGIHPDHRKEGLGRMLYQRFFEAARNHDRNIVRCVTAPVNQGSIAFHTRMGFQIEPSEAQKEGVAYSLDYDGAGEHRLKFVKKLF
jgi:ribosomal protein S18 acetylase RimI-like enzyme